MNCNNCNCNVAIRQSIINLTNSCQRRGSLGNGEFFELGECYAGQFRANDAKWPVAGLFLNHNEKNRKRLTA